MIGRPAALTITQEGAEVFATLEYAIPTILLMIFAAAESIEWKERN